MDGATREVNEDPDGPQWVISYNGERVYGVWLLPEDEAVIISLQG